jgi:hypothetical protein
MRRRAGQVKRNAGIGLFPVPSKDCLIMADYVYPAHKSSTLPQAVQTACTAFVRGHAQ